MHRDPVRRCINHRSAGASICGIDPMLGLTSLYHFLCGGSLSSLLRIMLVVMKALVLRMNKEWMHNKHHFLAVKLCEG
jgi:hypothetical protein